MGKKKKLFIIEIEIKSECWDYIKGQRIMIPINTSTAYHAELLFSNKYWGSEYPTYQIIKIHKCDNFIFSPYRFFDIN